MSAKTQIEWTRGEDGSPGATWNPVVGCRRVSEGCRNCYAETVAAGNVRRLRGVVEKTGSAKAKATLAAYEQTVKMDGDGNPRPLWSGRAIERPDVLDQPLRWQRPRRIFVNSMSDLFHDDVSDEYIAAVFGVMAAAEHHTFQVLTKRPERMLAWFRWLSTDADQQGAALYAYAARAMGWASRAEHGFVSDWMDRYKAWEHDWPLQNVHIGVSVEDDSNRGRIDELRRVPAVVRFLSLEPLLGQLQNLDLDGIGWVIVGGESGPGARPMHPEWVRDIRDQCQRADVPFFFKQWGEWYPAGGTGYPPFTDDVEAPYTWIDENTAVQYNSGCQPDACMLRVGKKAAGRLLDGVEHNDGPRAT